MSFESCSDRRVEIACWLMALLVLCLAAPAHAVIESYQFDDENQRARYHRFIEELRCPKCQNQNLAGSNSPIAADLRRELHRMIRSGQSDEQIVDFMVSRYGDFILYRPPVDRNTLVLWLAPVILLLLGVVMVFIYMRKQGGRSRGKQQRDPGRLSGEESAALEAILNRYRSP